MKSVWNNKWILSFLSGILLGLGYAPFPFPFITIIAWVFLLRVAVLSESSKAAAYFTYPAFVIWNIVGTYWLMMATVGGGIAAILANSAIMTIPLVIMRKVLQSDVSAFMKAILAAAAWTSYEFLHLYWDLAWPWLAIANAFSTTTWAVQYIEFTGYLSITFWALAVSVLIFEAIQKSTNTKKIWVQTGLTFFIPILASLAILQTVKTQSDETIHAVIAQPNFDSYLHLAGYNNAFEPLVEIASITNEAITENTDVIIWPENAIMGRVNNLRPTTYHHYLNDRASDWEIPIISGAAFYYYYDDNLPVVYRTDSFGRNFNFYNSGLGFYPDGSFEYYKKNKLVPMVERLPFLPLLVNIPWVDWPRHSGYGLGTEMHVFRAGNVLFPAVVCYDSVFPAVVREGVLLGAGFISVITNDGWWGDTSGHIQHYEFARLRAIETRRTVVRSANNGISGMILADGTPAYRTEYWTQTAFELEIPVFHHQTFYVRYGEWFGILMLVLTGLIFFIVRQR